MKNLMTRKLLFGMLMTLVLAFSVQGVAEAVVDPDIGDDILNPTALRVVGTSLNITFPAVLDAPGTVETVRITKSSGVDLTGSFNGLSSVTLRENGDVRADPNANPPVTAANGDMYSYTTNTNIKRLIAPGTITVPIVFTSKGRRTVTISGTDYDADNNGTTGDTKSWSYTYTYYVMGPGPNKTTTISLDNLGSGGYKTGFFAVPNISLRVHRGDSSHYAVAYSGNVVVKHPYDGSNVDAVGGMHSSAFDAYIEPSGNFATTQVTAQVQESNVIKVGTYIVGSPTLMVDEPDSDPDDNGNTDDAQTGSKSSPGDVDATLNNAFVATVDDGTGADVPGVVVRFQVRGSGTAGGYLVFDKMADGANTANDGTLVDSNNRERLNSDGDPIMSDTAKTLYVRTNGTGVANVDFQLGTDGKQDVTVTAVGKSETVSAYAGTVVSGDKLVRPRSTLRAGKYDLRVNVQDEDGNPLEDETVEFRTRPLDGTLELTDGSMRSDTVTDTTDTQGVAFVVFDPASSSGSATVTVSLLDLGGDSAYGGTGANADTIRDQTVINVRGSGVRDTPRSPSISISPTSVEGDPGDVETFTATLRDASGTPVFDVPVSFSINEPSGRFTSPSVRTLSNGTASSQLRLPTENARVTVSASGYGSATASVTVEGIPDELVKVSGDNQDDEPGDTLSSPFVVRVEDSDGDPVAGQTVSFSVTAGGGSLSQTSDTTDSDGEASTTLTLGSSEGTNTVVARVSGLTSVTFTATTETGPDDLVITGGNNQVGEVNQFLAEDLVVQVVDSDDDGIDRVLVRFSIEEGRGSLSRGSIRTDQDGFAVIRFVPRSRGTLEVEASVTGLDPVTFTITTGDPPDAIIKVSGDNQSGRPSTALANPFVVEVIDENEDPVSGVGVTFEVTGGGGTLSETSVTTDEDGQAETTLTLGEERGDNTVVARVSGVSEGVTFTATSGAEVVADASQRVPMYWVDRTNGTLHRLVDSEVENLAPNVRNATSIAVDESGGYIYWTAQTGTHKGAIRRSGLNGRGVETLKSLTSAPMGVAVDNTNGMLYWTNSRGRIQSMATTGGKITNVVVNLSSPGAIALSNGYLYWAEAIGGVRRMSLTATPKTTENIATGLGDPVSIAIAKGKIYWLERGGGGGGKLQRANLDGGGIEQLKNFASGAPVALAVDSSDNKIYWTRSTGKIQRSNLLGRFTKDMVIGLPSPGSIALGTAVEEEEPVVEQTTRRRQQTQQTVDTSKYDVNGDGAVDNLDVTIVALALGTTNPDYDVNGDGSVDANDLREVIANTDSNTGAPAIDVDLKGLDIDFDRVQEEIEMLLAAGDLSIEGQRVLRYLQHLLASARPSETVLLTNYPNPFNPETWIPYHLATGTDVQINIYDAQGILVRALTLGHQVAGYYTSRSRAAYWDGRNALGERVASGIYFYQLRTDEVSPMRKMVILK